MKYKFNQNGKEVEIQPERWVWGIIYKDGSAIHQFGGDGIFHQIREIRQDDIYVARIYRHDNPGKRIEIAWKPGMELVYKYRNIVFKSGEQSEKKIRVYVFGYKVGIAHHFNYILPDDRVVQSPEDDVSLATFI
jgi:hypothetical protein